MRFWSPSFPLPRASAFEPSYSGECGKDGDNLTWSYSDGVLTITGAGEMADFEELLDCPWYYKTSEIQRVELPDGLTSIGNRAFDGCDNLTVTVGHGTYAEQYCEDNDLNYQYPDSLDWLHG